MIIPNGFFLYDGGLEYGEACRAVATRLGMTPVNAPDVADVAIAPRLERRLPHEEWSAPYYGTLIFHPSALPHRRGRDAIQRAVEAGDAVSAATWFWCDNNLDTGDLCEQEVVILKHGESAGRAYHTRFVPAGLRALERALRGVLSGSPRRVPQEAIQ